MFAIIQLQVVLLRVIPTGMPSCFMILCCFKISITETFSFCSRRKRDINIYQFRAEHIIILSIKASGNSKTNVEIFVLDPSSTSPLPTKAYTSKKLTDMILKISESDLPYPLIPVGGNTVPGEVHDDEGGSSSVVPVAVGAAGGVLLLVAVAVAALCIIRRRKQKRCFALSLFFPLKTNIRILNNPIILTEC